MQRDRLEGWMVKQIEHADLAKETVIQLPTRTTATATNAKAANLRSLPARRRFLGHTIVQRPSTTPSQPWNHPQPPLSPSQRLRQKSPSATTRLETAAAAVGELDGEDSVARQWRLHFQDPDQSYEEDGRVDRSKVLKCISPRQPDRSRGDWQDDWEDEYESTTTTTTTEEEETPLMLWGMPREYILEYIRQSVMPTAWATHAKFTGEWEAASPASNVDGRYTANANATSSGDRSPVFLTSLPPLSARAAKRTGGSPLKSPRSPSSRAGPETSPSSRSYRRPHPGAATPPVASSPRRTTPRSEERIRHVLASLRADPKAWAAFQKDVKKFTDEQHKKQHESNKIRENKLLASLSPRAPAILAERKRRNSARIERTRQQRELLIQERDDENEAKLLAYKRKTQGNQDAESDKTRVDLTMTVAYRRRKMWLFVLAFTSSTTAFQQKLVRAKQQQVIDKLQTNAARVIQSLWKKWKWRHASKQTIVIYTWLRKCLWKILFNLRCRRKKRQATLLQKFMLDHFSGSRETRNFNRMMLKWRSKVILSQRLGQDFVYCTRVRLSALSIWWDLVDHERQRGERHYQDKLLPAPDEKEAEWNAIVNNRIKRPSSREMSTRSMLGTSVATSSTTTSTTSTGSPLVTLTPATTSSSNLNSSLVSSGSASSLSRRSVSTRELVDQMDERLTTMQQVLTPMEIQRLQRHAVHIVKIPKAIKFRLLNEFLTAARKDFMRRLTVYHEQVACAGYTRQVKLDDARAIVQNGTSWEALLLDSRTGQPNLRRPIFQLYSGDKQRRQMEEMIKRGVQLTLESDPEQRIVVERQRQQRSALEAGVSSPLAGSGSSNTTGSGSASSLSSSRRRESRVSAGLLGSSAIIPLPPSTGSSSSSATGDSAGGSRLKSNRKLTFAVPATIREKAK